MLDSVAGKLFNNVGSKLKSFAIIITWLGIIVFPIIGVVELRYENQIGWAYLIVVGPLVSMINGWLLYGFGELIDNTAIIIEYERKIAKSTKSIADKQDTPIIVKTFKNDETEEFSPSKD